MQEPQVAALLGMQRWKRRSIAAAFAQPGGSPQFVETPEAAVRLARARGGAIAAWATRVPAGFAARCAAEGIPLLWVEDGFLRSVGLGVDFAPAASLCVDPVAPHYDPAQASTLERLLSEGQFPPPLLARQPTHAVAPEQTHTPVFASLPLMPSGRWRHYRHHAHHWCCLHCPTSRVGSVPAACTAHSTAHGGRGGTAGDATGTRCCGAAEKYGRAWRC